MVLLVIWYCLSLLIKENRYPHISHTNFSCLCRYLFFSNEVCVLNPLPHSLQNWSWPCILYFRSSLCEIFLLWSLVEPCLWHVLEISVLSSVVSSKVSDDKYAWPIVFWCPSLFRGYSLLGFFMTKYLTVFVFDLLCLQYFCCLHLWTTSLPSILMRTLDIPSLVLSNMCLAKNFSRWNGSVSSGCLEVDESMPSVETVFNWVSGIKGDI